MKQIITLVTEQQDVLHHVKEYYADFFKSRDNIMFDTDSQKLG